MTFRKVTREIIESVEQISGYRVHVVKDPSLQVPATVRMVSSSMPYHVIIYNPTSNQAPDYLICYECGFITRLFTLPKEHRKVFTGQDQAKNLLRQQMTNELSLPQSIFDQLVTKCFEGILIQLRSLPIGFRVDSWLHTQHTELKDLQEHFVRSELSKNAQVLSPEIKKLAPSHLYECNVAMNATYALFWSLRLDDARLFLPYENIRQHKMADELLKAIQATPDSPEYDTALVDTWADILNLSTWYRWIPQALENEGQNG